MTATVCTPTGRGTWLTLNGSNPSTFTQYRFNYTAVTTQPIIIFGFQNENNREYELDTVSVVNNNASSIQLLRNPSFENSTLTLTGWVLWCSSTCSGYTGTIISGTDCLYSTGNCFKSKCYASTGIEFLGQSFSALIGNKYTISFWLNLGGSGTTAANKFYFDIV